MIADQRTVGGGGKVATQQVTPIAIAKASWPTTTVWPRSRPSTSGVAIATAVVMPSHNARSGGRCRSKTQSPIAVAPHGHGRIAEGRQTESTEAECGRQVDQRDPGGAGRQGGIHAQQSS